MPHRVRLPDLAVRYLAWLCLFLMLWPAFVVAAETPPPGAVPVVTRISGAVSVRGSDGVSNEVISSRIIHSGDLLMTGVDSLALINLADVGSVRIGPASNATAAVSGGALSVSISDGSACAQAVSSGVSIVAGPLVLTAADETAIFSVIRASNATTLAVYQGSVSARMGASTAKPLTFKAGEAAVSYGGNPQQVAIASVQPSFDALQCPDPDVIQSVLPSPSPSPAAGGSHGGGGAGFLWAILGLGAIAAAAGHGGGGGSGGGSSAPTIPPTTPPTPPPGALEVSTSSLNFSVDGGSQTFTASETNYLGPISAVSGNTGVATVTPASGNGPGPVTFTVTPTGAGGTSTTITVTDKHGGTQTVSVTIEQPGSIIVNPTTLTFLVGSGTQTFTASEANYSGPLSATSNNPNVATVAGSGNGPGPVTFTVTPGQAGTTSITVNGNGPPASVSVTVIGPLQANPTSLTFLGTTASQNFSVTDPFYSGTLTATSSDTSVATVSPSTAAGPNATFSVTPVNAKSTPITITITDSFGGSALVSVSVSNGGLIVNPGNLTLAVGGSTQTFTAGETDYTGQIHAKSSNTGQATVSPAEQKGPGPDTFTVTAVSAGNPTIAVSDDNSNVEFVDLTVTGPLTVGPPSSLTFNGTTAPQTLSVSDPNYFGSIGASSSDTSVATVDSPVAGPNATFTVTPVTSGTATITFTDANLASATASITVNPGPLKLSATSESLNGAGANAQFTASEVLYNGPIGAASENTGVVTVAPSSGSGPGPVTFTLTAVGPGSTNVDITDNHSGLQQVAVTVTEAPVLAPPAVTLTDVGSPGTSVSISEPGYTGAFSVVNNNCGSGGIANIGTPSGNGPSASVSVVGKKTTLSGGSCTFQIQDSLGNTSTAENVTVGPFGQVTPSSNSLTFTDITTAQQFTVSESGYSGQFTVDGSACSGVATVSPASGSSSTPFVVTPVAGGGPCNIVVSDDHGQSANVSVTVGPFGAISPNPTTFTFTDVGASAALPLTVTETGYTGVFTIDASLCSGIATVSPASSTGSFTVTPVASGGPCNLSITDDHGSTAAQVSVTVGPFGPVSPNPANIDLTVGGSSSSFSVSEMNYTGNFTINTSSCGSNSIASVTPASGNSSTNFSVSPVAEGNCKLVVTDDAGDVGNVDVFVVAGTIQVMPNEMQFAANPPPNTTQNFTAVDPACGPLDTMTATADGTVAASVSPTTVVPCPSSGGGATFTVTAGANGQGSVVVSDTAGGKATVSVGVGMSPLTKKHKGLGEHKPIPAPSGSPRIGGLGLAAKPSKPLPPGAHAPGQTAAPTPLGSLHVSVTSVTLVQSGPTQTVSISEPGYARLFHFTSANDSVASANVQTELGPTATLTIVPKGVGVTTIQIADDHGGTQVIQVTVRPMPPKAGSAPRQQ